MSKVMITEQYLEDIANAIRNKSGGGNAYKPSDMAAAIMNIPAGGGSIPGIEEPLNDVVFIDYDGEILHQYPADEFLALNALPANPSHTGLTAQGWNWSLADAQEYVGKYGTLCIGQNYVTDDGKTRIYLKVTEINLPFTFQLSFYTSVKGGAVIDWGDGSTTITTANPGISGEYNHTFQATGEYLVTIEVTDGTIELGYLYSNKTFFGNGEKFRHAALSVYKVELGASITQIDKQAFTYPYYMESISIPKNILFQDGHNSAVFGGSGIKGIVIPDGATHLTSICGTCNQLKMVSIPKSVVEISGESFSNDPELRMLTMPELTVINAGTLVAFSRKLERLSIPGTYTTIPQYLARYNYYFYGIVVVPSTVTSIADYVWTSTIVKEYHLLPTTPPALGHQRSIGRESGYTTIYVPYSADHSILNAYKTATNWSQMASFMMEEPQ